MLKDIKKLEKIYDDNDCKCLDKPPWTRCRMCIAAHILNEMGEMAREALENIEDATE